MRCIAALLLILVFVAGPTYSEPRPLPLANVYQEGANLTDYWVSEKLDGVRAYWDVEKLWSRGGHVYQSPEWFTEDFPVHPLDGELWMGRGQFAELSGIVRMARPDDGKWRQVAFHVFDLPAADVPFFKRYERLKQLVQASESSYLKLVEQRPISGHGALITELNRIVAAGGEGLMLKRKASLYLAGRSDDLLKVKTFQDAEAVVVEHIEGQGKYEGLLGSLLVELPDGRRFRIGSGFTDEERANPPQPGQQITFKHHGYTATGLPRFASFLRIRPDEPEAASQQ
ncbi:DNA ligase [Marinobacter sp. DUT-1]|uniref:DNA ligase n=1 Tax=Marinobacter sp. DUT-1 TaxID=3412037 RepID=UPI003D16A366